MPGACMGHAAPRAAIHPACLLHTQLRSRRTWQAPLAQVQPKLGRPRLATTSSERTAYAYMRCRCRQRRPKAVRPAWMPAAQDPRLQNSSIFVWRAAATGQRPSKCCCWDAAAAAAALPVTACGRLLRGRCPGCTAWRHKHPSRSAPKQLLLRRAALRSDDDLRHHDLHLGGVDDVRALQQVLHRL